MYKLRLAVLTCATAAMLLLALVAAGVTGAAPRTNACDVEDLWGGFFAGPLSGAGFVTFDITNQAPPAPADDDGSEDFALATQLALGLGNAGVGDKYHFRFETVFVSNLATARGHGFLFVVGDAATFVIAGHGGHPLAGSFRMTGDGGITCLNGEGIAANGTMYHLEFANGMTEDGTVPTMARCENIEGCEGDVG